MHIFNSGASISITAIGVVMGWIASNIFGGWNEIMTTLVILMAIDYITGIVVAGVFRTSKKTESGGLSSSTGFKGIVKKFIMLLLVAVGCRMDFMMTSLNLPLDNMISSGVSIALCINEIISITENAGLIGIPIPTIIKKSLEILQDKEES